MTPRWFEKEADGFHRCGLCFHSCRIKPGGRGYCGTRGVDEDGRFVSPALGRFCSMAVDPIEKKPLYHWKPGSRILSLGGLGCTMRCPFCQNHAIAQPQRDIPLTAITPENLTAKARELNLPSVAYTYNEPALQAEYILAAAPTLKEAGIETVLVTNGLLSEAALADLSPWLAALNIDVKTFNSEAYRRMGGSLEVVKKNVVYLVEKGLHVELTTLVVPGISDSPEEFTELVKWIASLSNTIPFHISRYFPNHLYAAPPTDPDLLRQFKEIAESKLAHVHLGNV